MRFKTTSMICALLLAICFGATAYAGDYMIVDTGQDNCYDENSWIPCPGIGESFYGQDARYNGFQPSYQDNGDGTVTDNNTGLMWQKTPYLDQKFEFYEALNGADSFSLAGYDDWRLPTIKELYSLINFNGSIFNLVPYIDTNYFDFAYPDTTQGWRIIDAQYWSSTEYVGTTMDNEPTVFGVNFADGRIKGYPRDNGPGGQTMTEFVRYVRGNINYGENNFVDNGNGTVIDLATGLIWQKADDGAARNWEDALAYAEGLELAGHDDWRLPNAKELQSIVDYTHAPDANDPELVGPAIDPIFDITNIGSQQEPDYGYYWSGTTHLDGPYPDFACYQTFGCAWGWMEIPPNSGNYVYMNVHGAGAQRSDPKSGDPSNWPHGNGPQGDEVRIYNYVRCVRGGNVITINMIPDSSPVTVPRGGSFNYTGMLLNNTQQSQTGDLWIMLELPDGAEYGPLYLINDISMNSAQNIIVDDIDQYVPTFAPLGTYKYKSYCGIYPDVKIDSSAFEFTVISGDDSGADSWALSGWFGDDGEEQLALKTSLDENYPNPFNASTAITYSLANDADVSIEVYNIMGQKVDVLVDNHQQAGEYGVKWDGSPYSSGIYFYKLTADDKTITRQMTLLK